MKYYFVADIEINVLFSMEEFELLNEAILNSEYKYQAEDPSGWWFKIANEISSYFGDKTDILPFAITFRNMDKLTKCLEKYCYGTSEAKHLAYCISGKIGTILRDCNAKSEEINELFTGDITELN